MTFDAIIGKSWESNRLFSALIELTYRCNLDCFFCYNDTALRGRPLSFDQYETLLGDLETMGAMTVVLSGGEPLAHPDFFRIGALARSRGFVVRIKSNGHALHGELARRLRDEVDPYVVEVSLHGGNAETHDRQTRVSGSFVRLMANIEELTTLGLRIKVNSTLTLWNEEQIERMYELTDALGVPLRFDLQVTPRDDGDRSPLNIAATPEGVRRLMRLDDERALRFSDEPASEVSLRPAADDTVPSVAGKHCGAGSSGITVDPYGNVYPCVQWRRPVGNLHERSIREIWQGSDVLDDIRSETVAVSAVVAAHPNGRLLNFCPGLAESLTGSALLVPAEMERQAAVVAAALENLSRS